MFACSTFASKVRKANDSYYWAVSTGCFDVKWRIEARVSHGTRSTVLCGIRKQHIIGLYRTRWVPSANDTLYEDEAWKRAHSAALRPIRHDAWPTTVVVQASQS